ncbi:hypothetical protein PBI_MYXUS_65 [Mycobacterium phage Myxus]|uniref:Uncharacterized protein n=6 Tax=Fromanvirus packman TaxID=1034142 RepID=G1BR70_9CAUD|nr:hypothetical protein AVV05_gp043 [Mycobacterium phage Pioneer]YP_009301889.1 hypothetical protein BJD80_gp044 [Mycobacterium phage Catalina]YP_009636034.1 hypothetical protein FGG56_gp39 [Mycobacterium phage PackMan]AMO43933.1 hypothetical protein PBI_MYXUS_65 [Mycobacterium phage Myxus]AOQ29022.1 hypothetical protein SEA_HORTUMSL17_66 [Mycobacterium phage HortumSL17]AOY12049.1 hypothetical protein SEA_PHAEDER_65 [Mycobacterium phage Phaeder]AVI04246.1 hypothetical protein SEA_PHONNEGUT_66
MGPIERIRQAVKGFPDPQINLRTYYQGGKKMGLITIEWVVPEDDE